MRPGVEDFVAPGARDIPDKSNQDVTSNHAKALENRCSSVLVTEAIYEDKPIESRRTIRVCKYIKTITAEPRSRRVSRQEATKAQ